MYSPLTGLVVAAAVILAAAAFGLVRRSRDGRLRPSSGDADVFRRLGAADGTHVTLLQFSSEFCAPCRATARVCESVAASVAGVRHVEVDAAGEVDAARALGVTRTPTLLVVDPAGRVIRRSVGQPPTRPHLLAAVSAAVHA